MNTKEMTREQISALADGELAEQHEELAFAALRHEEGRADWEIYHQIGDVLRSDDMAVNLSPGFAARMAACLDAEPAIIAPNLDRNQDRVIDSKRAAFAGTGGASQARRWALPSMAAAAAMATAAFFTTPQLMVALNGDGATSEVASKMASGIDQVGMEASTVPEGVVLRDPRIDDYLMAHQHVSPSLYSTAQFARSATFATDSNK